MATIAELENALRKAHAAGNVGHAKKFADAIRQMRSQPKADFSGVSGQATTVAAATAGAPEAPSFMDKVRRGLGQQELTLSDLITGQPAARRPATYNLTGQRDLSTQIGGFLDALQHRALDPLHGVGQLAAHGGNAVVQGVAGGSDYAQGVQQRVADNDRWLAQREADYQARTSGNEMSYGGSVAGAVAPWMVGIGQLRAAGALPQITATGIPGLAQKGGLLAAEGAAMGLAQPVTGDGPYGGQKAAQVGIGAVAAPAIAGGIRATGAGGRAIGRLAQYLTEGGREQVALRRLAKLYGVDDAALARLRQDTGIPGFQLTPAQALGTPEAVQAERVLRNNGATAAAFAGRESQNNAALRGAVERVAGDDAALAAAQQARREGPGAFWKENMQRGAEEGRYGRAAAHIKEYIESKAIPVPEWKILDEARKIAGQVQRGSIDQAEGDAAIRALQPTSKAGRKALEQALGLIDGGMVNPSRVITKLQTLARDTNPTISGAASKALERIAANQDGQGWVHGRVLDGLRQNFGTILADAAPPLKGAGSAEGAAFGPVKTSIVNTIDRAVPGYRDNLAAYGRASQPINDMEAARTLLGAIDSGGRDAGGNQSVNLAKVRQLLSKDDKARYPMSADARATLEAVLEALQKRSITNNTIAATGPGSAADVLRGLQNNPFAMRLLGHLTSAGGGVAFGLPGYAAGAALTEGLTAANSSVLRKVGQKGADAKLTADAIEAYRRKQIGSKSPLMRLLLPYEQRALPSGGGR